MPDREKVMVRKWMPYYWYIPLEEGEVPMDKGGFRTVVIDVEKVIKAFECCKRPYDRKCEECPYEKDCCHDGMPTFGLNDALALLNLLKEQEAKPIAEHGRMFSIRYGSCPNCLKPIDSDVNPKACGHCGQKVKWE